MPAEQPDHAAAHALRLRRLGIDTYQELVIFMRSDCPACRAEGFEARSRIKVSLGGRHIIATLNTVLGNLLDSDEASLSESAWLALEAKPGDLVRIGHADPVLSESRLRAKAYGERLSWVDFRAIVDDVSAGAYSDLQPAPFAGTVRGFDNRRLARTAKLAGAPRAKVAGLDLHVRLGAAVEQGQPLFTLYAEAPGELRYALDYFESQARIIDIPAEP